jgi:GT2 family glycosyltransferase
VYSDWLERLIAPLSDPKVALAYGKQRGDETTKYSERQILRKWFPELSNPSQDHPFCNNANVAIRRALWEKLPYDEVLTGLEDIDWAKRAMQLGHKIAYEAAAEIIHVHHESLKGIYNRYRREAIALKHIFPEQRFNWWNFIRLFFSNALSDYYHAWHERALWRNMRDVFLFRLIQFWGTYMGYAQHGPISSQLRQTFYYPNRLLRSMTHGSNTIGPEPRVRIEYGVKPSVDG